ncbi:hypothetical protein [Sphingobium aromaticiconvertens]|uniref:hypothetical protein n=1 Tax=Sphingobium aromaticiconvertens TaxID=365341 RepID=UPI00301973A0
MMQSLPIGRDRIACLAAATASSAGRGRRFLTRQAGGGSPTFAELAGLPAWPLLDREAQRRVAMIALLLAGRSTLAAEIDGIRLRAYAVLVGGPLFEDVLTDQSPGDAPLPSPSALPDAADDLLRVAVPPLLAHRIGDAGPHDPRAAACMARAERFIRESAAWPIS